MVAYMRRLQLQFSSGILTTLLYSTSLLSGIIFNVNPIKITISKREKVDFFINFRG